MTTRDNAAGFPVFTGWPAYCPKCTQPRDPRLGAFGCVCCSCEDKLLRAIHDAIEAYCVEVDAGDVGFNDMLGAVEGAVERIVVRKEGE